MKLPSPVDLLTNEEIIDELVRRQEITGSAFFIYIEDDEPPHDGTFWSMMTGEEASEMRDLYMDTLENGEAEGEGI